MYSGLLKQIDNDHADLAFKALQWMAFSTRPLYIEELAELSVIADQPETRIHPTQRLSNPQEILDILPGGLVKTTNVADGENRLDSADFQEQRQQMHLADSSLKDYLLSEQVQTESAKRYAVSETKAHASIAADCITYLLHFNQPYPTMAEEVRSSALLRYATNYWASHARHAGSDISEILPLIKKFLTSGTAYTNWTAFFDGFKPFDDAGHAEGHPSTISPNPLYYAASFGLLAIARNLLHEGAPVDSEGPAGTALAAASLAGDRGMVQLLMNHGADVHRDGPLDRPIRLASQNQHLEVVEYLSMKGAK